MVHVAIGNKHRPHGNFPPEVPYFAGLPLTYHWFADFHGAITRPSPRTWPIIPVFFLSSALLAGYAGARRLVGWALPDTKDRRVADDRGDRLRRRAGWAGCGWLGTSSALGGYSIPELITQRPVRQLVGRRVAVVPDRLGLRHGVPAAPGDDVRLARSGRRGPADRARPGRRPAAVLLGGVLAALLAPFQFDFFPATYLIVGLYVVFGRRAGAQRTALSVTRRCFWHRSRCAPVRGCRLAFRQGAQGAFRFVPGLERIAGLRTDRCAARSSTSPTWASRLCWRSSSLVAAAGPRLPRRAGFIAAWLVALFLVPNLVVVSAVEFDMNNDFQIMWIAVAIAAAWLLVRWPRWDRGRGRSACRRSRRR